MTTTTMTVFLYQRISVAVQQFNVHNGFCLPKTHINVHFTSVAFFILNHSAVG